MVLHVFKPNSNRTLESSINFGLQVLSKRVVLRGFTAGQVVFVLVNTVMIPSVEQTGKTKKRSKLQMTSQYKNKACELWMDTHL